MLTLTGRSCGNPDYQQDPYRPVYGVPNLLLTGTPKELRDAWLQWIGRHELGGGNIAESSIHDAEGNLVGRFSYNGRIWSPEDKELRIVGDSLEKVDGE